MILRVEGTLPDEATLAAIVAVLDTYREAAPAPPQKRSAWRLSALLPDLTLDDVRALAQSGSNVF